jgi:hypothetical protein
MLLAPSGNICGKNHLYLRCKPCRLCPVLLLEIQYYNISVPQPILKSFFSHIKALMMLGGCYSGLLISNTKRDKNSRHSFAVRLKLSLQEGGSRGTNAFLVKISSNLPAQIENKRYH